MLNYVPFLVHCSSYAILPYPTVAEDFCECIQLCYTIYHLHSIYFLLYTKPYCNLLQTMLEAMVYTADYIAHYTIDHRLDYKLYNMFC